MEHLTDDRSLFRTSDGTRDVVTRLTRDLTDIRTHCSVVRIEETVDSVSVFTDDDETECFDHVIVATQANTALKLLPLIPRVETEILEAIPYEDVHVSVHRDESLMPTKRSNWRTFNMQCHENADGLIDHADCTVWLNRFDPGISAQPELFQTISPQVGPKASDVITGTTLQRPAVSVRSSSQLQKLEQLQQSPDRRIWYCGSWAAQGCRCWRQLLYRRDALSIVSCKRLDRCVRR